MEQLHNGCVLETVSGTFPLSTDSMLLAHFATLPKSAQVLDLGSGCGTLGLLLCSRDSGCRITGVELSEEAHAAALDNICRSGLAPRFKSICLDLRQVPSYFAPCSFQCCISNPPYFSGGPASSRTPLARRGDFCTPGDLFRSAAWALKSGGDFFLVHRPEKLAQLIACGAANGMEAKRLRLVHHREGGPISLILLSFRKGGKPGLAIDEQNLFDSREAPTAYYREVYE